MKKILLSLVAAFFATFAMAQDYPVVTSVEELATYSDSTMVEFQNIQVVVQEVDMGYYVQTNYCLSDGTTQIGGNVYPVPDCFTAVGFVHTVNSWDGTSYREFYVDKVVSVSSFKTLAELIRYGSQESNREVITNSPGVKALEGTIVVTSVFDDYIFYYTMYNSGWYSEPIYGVMSYPGASDEFRIGDELMADGGFKGAYTPAYIEYDADWNEVSHKGGCFAIDESVDMWAINWTPVPIMYGSCDLSDITSGYLREAQLVRFPGGGKFVERDGKYFYEATYMVEQYVDGQGWVDVEMTASLETVSKYVDLSQYVGITIEDFLGGVWDYSNTGDNDRLILNTFISPVSHYDNISDFTAVGEQYEEEIITEFDNPLQVTYKFDDGQFKFILIVADETGSVAIDYSETVNPDDPNYAALQAINVGDYITGVKGYPQYYLNSCAPRIYGSTYDYDTYEAITYVPTVVSTGSTVQPTMTITVGDMLNEWADCQENSSMPKIASKVVRLLDVQVVDTTDTWGYPVTYLIQGTDTMELSNLWGEDKMNFTTYERNNMVGIADYCIINTNYIYQFMPLSQEHITDASIVPVVEDVAELPNYVGVPVILKNAEIKAIIEGWYADYYLQDGETFAYGLNACGKYDLLGLYETSEYGNSFTVLEVKDVHGFASIGDIATYTQLVPEAAGTEYDVYGEMIVTHVDGENAFVQYDFINSWGGKEAQGSMVIGLNNAKQGDIIKDIKGVASPCDYYQDASYNYVVDRGAYFTMSEGVEVTVVSSDNAIPYSQAQDVTRIYGSAPTYQATAISVKASSDLLEDGGRYYLQEEAYTYDEEWNAIPVTYTIELVSNTVDLSALVGTTPEDLYVGVLDFKNSNAEDVKMYVHAMKSTNTEYQTIREILEAGPNGDYSLTVSLANPAVITYISYSEYDGSVIVQDETAGIMLSMTSGEGLEDLKVGDAITGIKGCATWSDGYTPYLGAYDQDDWSNYTFTVVSSENNVAAKEVTVAQLNEEERAAIEEYATPVTYVSNLVLLRNVTYTTAVDPYGEEWPCLKQGEDVLFVVKDFAEKYGVVEGQEFDVIGVVDYRRLNYSNLYTIHPRSAADIHAAGVEGVELNNGRIYLDAAYQVVAEGAVEVAIYDVNGRLVGTDNAAGLAKGVYVVRATYADGAVKTAKVVR